MSGHNLMSHIDPAGSWLTNSEGHRMRLGVLRGIRGIDHHLRECARQCSFYVDLERVGGIQMA